MQYSVWSHGELIGHTDMGFRTLGFERALSGDFHPTSRGTELLETLASDSHCMRAYMHRNYRDASGNGIIALEYVNSDWFGDVAEHLHQCAHFALELRDENDAVVPVAEIGIQDKEPHWPKPLTQEELLALEVKDAEAEIARRKEHRVDAEWQISKDIEGEIAYDMDAIKELYPDQNDKQFGVDGEYFPCDITVPVGWDYDEYRGNYELGSGWNETLRQVPDFPRYQIHVVLADAR